MACTARSGTTKEGANYARLCCLLIDVGYQALRDTFDRIHAPSSLHTILASPQVHSNLQGLFTDRKISPAQWVKLYPAIRPSVSSANFDMGLLLVLLRNVCGLTPPPAGWDAYPSDADNGCEAEIVRVTCFGSTVYSYAEHAVVNDVTYHTLWQNIREALVRLGGARYGPAIDNLKTASMDSFIEEHYKEIFQQWQREDYIIKNRLDEMRNDIKYIKEQFKIMQMAVDSINNRGNKTDPSKGPTYDYSEIGSDLHCSKRPSPLGGASSHGEFTQMQAEEMKAFDSTEPDENQSQSTDFELPSLEVSSETVAPMNERSHPAFMIPASLLKKNRHSDGATAFGKVSDHELYGLDTAGHETRQRQSGTQHDPSRLSHHSDFLRPTVDTFTGGFHSLPYHSTGAPRYTYPAQNYAYFAGEGIQGLNVDPQSHASRYVTSGSRCIDKVVHHKTSSSNDSHQQGLPLAGCQDMSSPANHQFPVREFSQLSDGREVTTGANDSSAELGTNPEPMDIGQREHNRLHSKGITERVYNRRKTESGVADLKDTLHYNLTLENESYKKPSSTREAPSSKVGTTRVDHICGREVTGIPQPSRPAVQGSADYGTSTLTSDTRTSGRPIKGTQSSERQNSNEMENSKLIFTRSNTEQRNQDETRWSQSQSEGSSKADSDRGARLPSLRNDRRVEGARSDPASEATASSLQKDRHSDGATASASKRDSSQGERSCAAVSLCNHCTLQGQLICKNCLVIICKACHEIFETNLCDSTKGKHVFQELEDKGNSKKTAEMAAMSNQEHTANGGDKKEWNCSRCTYLNSPEHGICVICATTRGVDTVQLSKPGSTVCRHCTLHNDEGAKVCVACHKTLNHSETFI